MTTVEYAGVNLLEGRDGIRFVRPSKTDYQPCVDFIREARDDKLILWLRSIQEHDAVEMLLRCNGIDDIRRLHIQTKALAGIERLSSLRLRTFSADDAIAFDFSGMSELESVGGVWSEMWSGLDHCPSIRRVHVSAFKRETLEGLSWLSSVKELTLIQTGLRSLKGVDAASGLRELSISYARLLRNIGSLAGLDGLRRLELESSRKIEDFADIGSIPGLEFLLLKQCGALASISFIERNLHLVGLALIDTKVTDLDLSYCLTHPTLRHFGATGLRGATPSVSEVETSLSARRSSSQ